MTRKELTVEELIYIDPKRLDVPKQTAYFTNTEFVALMNHLCRIDGSGNLYAKVSTMIERKYKAIRKYKGENEQLSYYKELLMEYRSQARGISGEHVVEAYLKQYENQWMIFGNINLPETSLRTGNYDTVENDFIVIANGHIFTIEAKSYYVDKVIISSDGNATFIYPDGSYKDGEKVNVVTQASRHTDALSKLLNEESRKDINFRNLIHSIIVLTTDNPRLTVDNKSPIPVIRPTLLSEVISGHPQSELTKEDEKEIAEIIRKNSKPDKRFLFPNPLFYFDKLGEAELRCAREESYYE